MYKILIGICLAFFSISLATGQPVSFQQQTMNKPSNTNNRTPLTPEQFRNKVHTQSEKNRRELSESARKNAKPISINISPLTQKPTQSASQPQNNYTATPTSQDTSVYNEEPYTEQKLVPAPPKPPTTTTTPPTPSTPPARQQNTQVYTGFPTGNGGGSTVNKPANSGSSSGGWNINY